MRFISGTNMASVALWMIAIFRMVMWSGYFGISIIITLKDTCAMRISLIVVQVSYFINMVMILSRLFCSDRCKHFDFLILTLQTMPVGGIVLSTVALTIAQSEEIPSCYNLFRFIVGYCSIETFCIIVFEVVTPYVMKTKTGYLFINDRLRDMETGIEVPAKDHQCIICLSDYETCDDVAVLKCEHTFHKRCLQHWFIEHNTCPCCRGVIASADLLNFKEPITEYESLMY